MLELCIILFNYSVFPGDDLGMNKTLSVFYLLLPGTGNVTLKSLLLVLSKVLIVGIEESSWRVKQTLLVTA